MVGNDASLTADLSTERWRRGSGLEPVLRNSRNTCSRSVATCWWSIEARKRRGSTPLRRRQSLSRLSFSHCGEFKPMETGRIVVPASRRTRTATDLSPKTGEGRKEETRPIPLFYVSSSNFLSSTRRVLENSHEIWKIQPEFKRQIDFYFP